MTKQTLCGSNRPVFGILSIAFLCLCGFASAETYYVAMNGNDSNPGTIDAPQRTIQRAANLASPGDTVIVRDGTYGHVNAVSGGDGSADNFSPVVLYRSGAPGAEITFKAENKWGAILDCEMLCDSYFNLLNASYITIQDFVIKRGYNEAIHSNDTAHHITLRGNRMEFIGNRIKTTDIGIVGLYTNPNCHDFVIDGNVFHDIGRTGGLPYPNHDHGLYLHGTNFLIINNIFYNLTQGWGIQMADGLSNVMIANNTFAFPNPRRDGHIVFWQNQSNITIRNNIFYNPQNNAIARFGSLVTGCAIDHNIVYGAYGVMADPSGCVVSNNRLGVDPQFVRATTAPYDFHLLPTSPAINAGADLVAVGTDFDGTPRPQGSAYGIGAFEFPRVPRSAETRRPGYRRRHRLSAPEL
jgi:hypothetical protein